MTRSRFTEEQVIGFIKQAEAGMPIQALRRKGGFSDATFYKLGIGYIHVAELDPPRNAP